MMPGLHFYNLYKSFGAPPTAVLKGVSAEIRAGDFVSITGRSGSGKSTLLYLISTLDQPTSGQIIMDGADIQTLSDIELHRFRNLNMGFVFQFHHLLPELSALENILMPAYKTHREKEREKYARDLLGEFGISDKADRMPSQLSGGEQQRVAIARALVMQPRYLFADEPTGNLDSANGNAVLALFKKINKTLGTTIIFVTHDVEFAAQANRRIHLVDGCVGDG